jgi:hypothetical protein
MLSRAACPATGVIMLTLTTLMIGSLTVRSLLPSLVFLADVSVFADQQLYYGPHYARLESIKKAVDPNNVFVFPTSVEEPGSTGNSTPPVTPKTIHPSASSSKCVGLVGGTFADGTQLDM